MRSTLVFLGLLSVFMLVSSLPSGSADLEKDQSGGHTTSGGLLGGGHKDCKGLSILGLLCL